MHENAALQGGYGPRVPCTFVALPSEQKQLCHTFFIYSWSSPADSTTPYWHRNADGTLSRGMLTQWGMKCPSLYYIYVPQDLSTCSQVVVICHDLHNHPPPALIKMPLSLVDVLDKLLSNMGWRLADATQCLIQALFKDYGWHLAGSQTSTQVFLTFTHRLQTWITSDDWLHMSSFSSSRMVLASKVDEPSTYIIKNSANPVYSCLSSC